MIKTKPTLLILAAGLGSRYGSLKQIDQIGPSGERIIDYSVYDAIKAGFGKIVYVIRESFKEEFNEVILDKLPPEIKTDIVCQELDSVPSEIPLSKERIKPWGTGHALLTATSAIKEPFAVINADDFYGAESFKIAANFLTSVESNSMYALIGYLMNNTLSEFGSVSRGICEVNSSNFLSSIVERIEIKISENKISFKNGNDSCKSLTGDKIVSMNMFAFTPSVFKHFEEYFKKFIMDSGDDQKAEYLMPSVIDNLI
ncbi:MAG: nucleotidyltransferase, partial [Arcobacter sp.]|nr:nucleotidyltransferase [Arcobacter sp.]